MWFHHNCAGGCYSESSQHCMEGRGMAETPTIIRGGGEISESYLDWWGRVKDDSRPYYILGGGRVSGSYHNSRNEGGLTVSCTILLGIGGE